MARILVNVEGETEETFVRDILAPHLLNNGHFASARLIGNARLRSRRGGIRGWDSVSRDLVIRLKSDPTCVVTTMVDYYGLPASGTGLWPGRDVASTVDFTQKSSVVEAALSADIARRVGNTFRPNMFIPFVIMHEFEGLLFSDCAAFAASLGKPALANQLLGIRTQFGTPEEINDSPVSAPSKRVLKLVPGYQKPLQGNTAIRAMGLDVVRNECPFFDNWLTRLESLPA